MPVGNALYLLNEIELALEEWLRSGARRTIYLSQFPMSEEDVAELKQALGTGAVAIASNRQDRTVWREAAIAGVWWGEYYTGGRYTSPEKMTLQTIEIGAFPELAEAQRDDVADGLNALRARAR